MHMFPMQIYVWMNKILDKSNEASTISLLWILRGTLSFPSILENCSYVKDGVKLTASTTDKIKIAGNSAVVVAMQEECISLCKATADCYWWSYYTTDYALPSKHKECHLMKKSYKSTQMDGVNSGSRYLCNGNYNYIII